MMEIPHKVQSYRHQSRSVQPGPATVSQVRANPGIRVGSYIELVEKVAAIAYANPDFVLFFRGQSHDFPHGGPSTLFPTMFRDGQNGEYRLRERYNRLVKKELALKTDVPEEFRKRLERNQLLRWAVLQHYEVCRTPLLDVTQSLRIASAFAFGDSINDGDDAIMYVLGLPQVSGSVTVVAEQFLHIVRLSSVCPPVTLRPYLQEGYLIGTFPFLDIYDQKAQFDRREVDCANRLVAKFRLKRANFWDGDCSRVTQNELLPPESNTFSHAVKSLRDSESPS